MEEGKIKQWQLCAMREAKTICEEHKDIYARWKRFAETGACGAIDCDLCPIGSEKCIDKHTGHRTLSKEKVMSVLNERKIEGEKNEVI